MRNWSPEPFQVEAAATIKSQAPAARFEVAGAAPATATGRRPFHRETGFSDPHTLLASLTADERAQIFDLVEQDVQRAFAAKEAELLAETERRLAAAAAAHEADLLRWSETFAAELRERAQADLGEAARAAANLAVALAGKIVRAAVPGDPAILERAVETVLFKVQGAGTLTVAVHPEDAARLTGLPALRERLNIGQVEADRRIERGGALIRCAGREWDATLEGQLATLGELVTEMVLTAGGDPLAAAPPQPAPEPGETDEPGLD